MTHPFALDVDTLSGMRPLSTAVFALGSNLGDRRKQLAEAIGSLGSWVTSVSPVYETDPVDVPDAFAQQRYLNQIVIVETALEPQDFSRRMHAIEQRLGRTRGAVRNLPRTIDIDIITLDEMARQLDPGDGERELVEPLLVGLLGRPERVLEGGVHGIRLQPTQLLQVGDPPVADRLGDDAGKPDLGYALF